MPHVAFVPLTGFRVKEEELLALGMTLPGLRQRAAAIAELPALGVLTLAGMLPNEWSCSYHGADRVSEELLNAIVSQRPTLAAVSALSASVEEAYDLGQRLRAENVQVVLGGLHATTCWEEAQRYCDAVVVGEGEAVWLDLLRDAAAGELRPIYRGPAPTLWPLPRFDLLDSPPRFTLQTQRGCPLACDFCAASRLLGKFREKPVESIRDELAMIRHIASQPLLELADDNTFVGQRDFSALFDALEASQARYFTEADWRIGERPDILERLAASGCVQVLVGIESLVFRYPGMGAKQAELERVMRALQAVQESGVAVNGCFIIGADGETRHSLDRLVQAILASPLAEVQITLQTPFPGTALRHRLDRAGRLLDCGWSSYTLFDVTFQPDCLSVAELEQGFRDVLGAVYSRQATRRRQHIRREVWRNNPRLRSAGLARWQGSDEP